MSLSHPLRLGYILKQYPRYSETFIVRYILAHEAAGLELEIFSLRPPSDSHFQDSIARVRAPVRYLPSNGLKATDLWEAAERAGEVLPGVWARLEAARGEAARDVHQALLLAREVRLRGIQHLHAHFATNATAVARLAARFADVPYTFHAHAKDIFHDSVRAEDLRRKLSEAAGVITVTDYNLEFLRARYGAAAAGVRHIYNGLDLDQYRFVAPDDRPPRIVSVGRLVEKKGFCDLIRACALLARAGRQFCCQIIGSGPLEADLRAQIEQLGLQGTVELAGPRPQSEVLNEVQAARVYAGPFVIGSDGDRDGLPNVLLEAMALGTPCVSTDVTGIPEVLRDGETGLMVPQHDPAALAVAVDRLLGDCSLRVHLATEARRLIEAEFDIHRNTERMRDMFRSAVRSREPAAQPVR